MASNIVTTGQISLGDITSARFLATSAWSVGVMFRRSSFATVGVMVGKWGSSAERQFRFEVSSGASPRPIRVRTGNAQSITGNVSLVTDNWYGSVVTNDGTGASNGMALYTANLQSGATVDNGVLGTHNGNVATLTASIILGSDASSGGNLLVGDIANVVYSSTQWSANKIFEYFRTPHRVAVRETCEFFIPVLGVTTEPDWSGNVRNGTASSVTVANNPPGIAPWYGFDTGEGHLVAAAAAPAPQPTKQNTLWLFT